MIRRRQFARILARFAAGAGLAFLCACENASGPGPASPAFVSLERTTTGEAGGPAYLVTLFADGHVLFEGRAGVKRQGTFTRQIPRAEADRIFAEIESVNFWEREPRYDVQRGGENDNQILRTASSEAAWDIIIARNRGRFKRIDGLFFAPGVLLDLKAHIERAVGLADWLASPAEEKN